MYSSLEWIDLTYDVEFDPPAFALPKAGTDVLKALYEKIHPRFPINTRDMQVTGGNELSDVRLRATLFGGNGVIDVRVDRMSLGFDNLKKEADLTECKDCVRLSEAALQDSLPAVHFREVAIKPTLFLKLKGGEEDVENYMSRLPGTRIRLDLSEFGAAVQRPEVSLEVGNPEEGWYVLFHAFRDREEASSLILSCQAFYQANGRVRGLEDRADHLKKLLKAFLGGMGLEPEGWTV